MFWFATVVALGVFIGFMSLVGNPSEVETLIALALAVVAFFLALLYGWKWKTAAREEDRNDKIVALERELEALRSKR